MSETKFTPGPWKQYGFLVYAPGPYGANICAISEPRATTSVSYTPVALGGGTDEVIANLHLIAASPEMFAALEPFAREAARFFMPGGSLAHLDDNDGASVPIGDLRRAFAALQRARGETP